MSMFANPQVRFESADALLAAAAALERQAAIGYRELSARMARQGDSAIADQFERLAVMTDCRASDISERSRKIAGQSPVQIEAGWALLAGYDEEEKRGSTRSVYQALAFAVRNEERAFAFCTYVAAATDNPQIRALAEDLAREELTHLAILRGHRRRAFHADRPATFALPMNVDELRALATAWDAEAATAHDALAEMLGQAGDADAAAAFRRLAARERPVASPNVGRKSKLRTPADGLRLLEDGFDCYARIGERSDDEGVVREAQRLAAEMIARLAIVGGTPNNGFLRAPTR